MLFKSRYICKKISMICMLTSDFHANQIVFVWSCLKRLGTNGFKFSAKGSLGQHNMVQSCFHQARTGCAFFAAYNEFNVLAKAVQCCGIRWIDLCNKRLLISKLNAVFVIITI